jgi:uncharacterized paraquat-inducible protein A
MFCPKCAAELVSYKGSLTCLTGEMGLSQQLEQIRLERYGRHEPRPKQPVSTSSANNPYYCPGCSSLLDSEMVCPDCHLSLKDQRHTLIELHPHKSADGGWR